jgi:hypothetical protein
LIYFQPRKANSTTVLPAQNSLKQKACQIRFDPCVFANQQLLDAAPATTQITLAVQISEAVISYRCTWQIKGIVKGTDQVSRPCRQ